MLSLSSFPQKPPQPAMKNLPFQSLVDRGAYVAEHTAIFGQGGLPRHDRGGQEIGLVDLQFGELSAVRSKRRRCTGGRKNDGGAGRDAEPNHM
jgi:hypothetical protein